MGSIGVRLRNERVRLGLNQTEFAQISGQSKKSQIRYEGNERSPDSMYLASIAAKGADVLYILTGERYNRTRSAELVGRTQDTSISSTDRSLPGHGDFQISGHEFQHVRIWDVTVSAGPGLIAQSENSVGSLAMNSEWLSKMGINGDLAGLVQVKGDSMAPTIPDQAMVLVHAGEMTVSQDGDIFAFTLDDEVFIKRLSQFEQNGVRGYIMTSDNPAYPPRTIVSGNHDLFRIAGRVRAVVSSFN